MKRILKKEIPDNILIAVALIALIIAAVPLLRLAKFAVPCSDDFVLSYVVFNGIEKGESPAKIIINMLKEVAATYKNWQGTFAAIFLFQLQPAVFGEKFYAITTYIMFAAIVLGNLAICEALFSGVFGTSKKHAAIIGLIISIICLEFMPSPVEGLYWYNGSVYYIVFNSIMQISTLLIVRLLKNGGGIWTIIALCALEIVIGGGNFVTALSACIAMLSIIILGLIKKDTNVKKLIAPTVFLLLAFVISISAPGNAIRQKAFDINPGVIKSILWSFRDGAIYAVKWFHLGTIGFTVIMLPILWVEASNTKFEFKYPFLVTVYSFCFFSAMFCPSIYATGSSDSGRILNIIFFTYVILLIVNIFCWLGWVSSRLGKKSSGIKIGPMSAAGLAAAVILFSSLVRGQFYTSVAANSELHSEELIQFTQVYRQRFSVLNNDSIKDAELEPLRCCPFLLYHDDMGSIDPNDWINISLARYYGKDTVKISSRLP